MPTPATILVTGATGRFGRICDLLLARGHRVLAPTRRPDAPAAVRLARAGAQVVPGDLDDPPGLRAAMARVDAVFASGTMHQAGPAGELRHGTTIAAAAQAAGVGHLVYVSGAGAVPGTGVPQLEVKAEVEAALARLDVPVTVVAPAYFMDNLANPWNRAALAAGRVPSFLPPDRPLVQVAVADVIALGVAALEDPARYRGRRIEIAGDAPTAVEMAAALTRALGRPFAVDQIPADEVGPGLAPLFAHLARTQPVVDVAGLRRDHPGVAWHTFAAWAAACGRRQLEAAA